MALLSDEEADEIRRDVEAGIHGPILRKWIRLLLEDRAARTPARATMGPPMVTIRPASDRDRDAVWSIFHAVIAEGDTYVFDPATPRDEALAYWFQAGAQSYVAELEGRVVGSYLLKPNQPGLGSHVANAAFMVSAQARGRGVGQAMGEHCLAEARRLGYRAMQFNFVVSTNESAVRLWERLGFRIVGTLPGVFRHRTRGFVDAHVMFRSLTEA
jgi:L-amino acid N-acyltransferase YncA